MLILFSFKGKKGEELALRTIILWILALLVLIVVVLLFHNQIGSLLNSFAGIVKQVVSLGNNTI